VPVLVLFVFFVLVIILQATARTLVCFSTGTGAGFVCAIRTPKIADAGASLLRSTGRPAASSYRPGDGHGHAVLKALRSRETTGVCRKKSLWSGNSAIALRRWRMPTSTICAAVGWGEVG
jgi:hypothetical protein